MPAAFVYGEKRKLPDGFEDFLDPKRTAIISIDMHQGHLADTPDCPCPAPRARKIVKPIDGFHERVRKIGVPIIHVRSVLRKGGIDDARAAWRRAFPLHVGPIPNSEEHAIEVLRQPRHFPEAISSRVQEVREALLAMLQLLDHTAVRRKR